jgi:transcriptional regulator with XRE-family HTH domain
MTQSPGTTPSFNNGWDIPLMELNMLIAQRLKETRQRKGLTQNELSIRSGVHEKAIAKYERGAGMPGADSIVKLAQALEISADYLLFPYAKPNGVPVVKDPILYDRYFVLESLQEEDRKSILNLLDSVIARKKLREITQTYS